MLLCTPPDHPGTTITQYCPSHELGSSSFTYSDWRVCKQKAPFILQLTSKLRGFLSFQISGPLCGFSFFFTHKCCTKLLGSLLEGDSFGSPASHSRVSLPLSYKVNLEFYTCTQAKADMITHINLLRVATTSQLSTPDDDQTTTSNRATSNASC